MIIIIENKMENGRDYAKSVSTIIATNVTQRVILFKVTLFEENYSTFSTLAHPGYIERKKKKKEEDNFARIVYVRCNNRKYHELDKKDDDSCDDSCNTIFQKDLSKRKREREKKKGTNNDF